MATWGYAVARLTALAYGKRPLFLLAAAGLLLRAAIATPTSDDGHNYFHIIGPPPYYSDYFRMYLPIYKPLTTIQMPARFMPYPWSFLYVSLLHTVVMAAGAYLTYRVSLRYAPKAAAAVAGGLTFLLMDLHEWISPTRPEPWLLAVLMGVVYLCDTWRLRGGGKLVAACAVTGILALPMHTNASIIYLYLGLFALWQRHRLTRHDCAIAAAALTAASLVGLAMLLIPKPALLFDLLSMFSHRSRFTFILSEFHRWSRLAWAINFDPLFTLSVFFGMTGIAAVATLRPTLASIRAFVSQYAGILIVALAAFIGLVLLVSASWTQYIAYYLPSLTLMAALAYGRRPSSRLAMTAYALAAIVATGALIIGIRLRWGDGLNALTLAVLAHAALLGALLCAGWLTRMRTFLACAVLVALLASTALSAERYLSFRSPIEDYRAMAREFGVDTIYAYDELGWVFTGSPAHAPFNRLLDDPSQIRSGIVVFTIRGAELTPDSARLMAVLQEGPCALTEIDRRSTRRLPLVEKLSHRELVAYLLKCDSHTASVAAPPPAPPGGLPR